MNYREHRSHELRITIELDDTEAFVHHKRSYGVVKRDPLAINVTGVRVTATFDDYDFTPKSSVHVALFGHNVLKDGNLGAERHDAYLKLDALPAKLRRNVEAHIASFAATIPSTRSL